VGEYLVYFFFFQAEDGIRDRTVTGVQTCALPISSCSTGEPPHSSSSSSSIRRRSSGDAPCARQRARTNVRNTFSKSKLSPQGGRSEERRVGKEWRSRWGPNH